MTFYASLDRKTETTFLMTGLGRSAAIIAGQL